MCAAGEMLFLSYIRTFWIRFLILRTNTPNKSRILILPKLSICSSDQLRSACYCSSSYGPNERPIHPLLHPRNLNMRKTTYWSHWKPVVDSHVHLSTLTPQTWTLVLECYFSVCRFRLVTRRLGRCREQEMCHVHTHLLSKILPHALHTKSGITRPAPVCMMGCFFH